MEIGERIHQVMLAKGFTAHRLSLLIPCERTNVYKIFKRKTIETHLLMRISVVLEHDFFAELSQEAVSNIYKMQLTNNRMNK